MSFDKSAQKLEKKLPLINVLAKSNPPSNVIKPINTTTCMKSFFLLGNAIDKYEKTLIATPKKLGM